MSKELEKFEQKADSKQLVESFKQIASKYHKQKNNEKDKEFIDEFKNIFSKSDAINLSLEKLLDEINKFHDSLFKIDILENFINTYPLYSKSYFVLAKVSYNLNLFEKSKENYELFLKLHDRNDKENLSIACNNLAILFSTPYFNEYNLSREYYTKAIELLPDNIEANNNLGLLLQSEYFKEYELAKSYFEKVINLAPDYALAYSSLASNYILDYSQNFELARKYYEKSIALNPKHSLTYHNLANLLVSDYFQDYQLGIEFYKKSIKYNAENFHSYNNLGVIYYEKFGDYQNAKICYEEGLKINNEYVYLHFNYAELLANKLNDKEKAKYHFNKAIELEGNETIQRSAINQLSVIVIGEQKQTFVSKISINRILHLKKIEINISEKQLKHLIITGHNGCGKTVLINRLRDYLQKLIDCNAEVALMNNFEKKLDFENPDLFFIKAKAIDLYYKYRTGEFIIAHFPARRNLKLSGIKNVENIELPMFSRIINEGKDTYHTKNNFLKFAINKYVQGGLASLQKDEKRVKEIKNWISNFERIIKKFDDRIEQVLFETNPDYHFILIPKKPYENFTFEQLADGFASSFSIVAELILRMQNKSILTYDIEGLVLIDEPEAHLHIEVQKLILPTLVELFPKIQFIVATHSPFILSSLPNAVVFDLEKKEKIEDLTKYSVDNIIETYFETDKYSIHLKEKLIKFEQLNAKKQLTEFENSELKKLQEYFSLFYESFSPEIQVKLQQIRLSNIGK